MPIVYFAIIVVLWKYLLMCDTSYFPPPLFPINTSRKDVHVVTYNMNGLPCNRKPIREIEEYLLRFDVVLLQECFTNLFHGKYFFLNRLNKYFHVHTDSHDLITDKMESSGMVILSRFPIVSSDFAPFTVLYGVDYFANKGIMKSTLLIHGQLIDVYNTHFQDGDVECCLHQLRKYINPLEHPTIIGGDFNTEKTNIGGQTQQTPPTWENKRYDHFITYDVHVTHQDVCTFNGISDHNAVFIVVNF